MKKTLSVALITLAGAHQAQACTVDTSLVSPAAPFFNTLQAAVDTCTTPIDIVDANLVEEVLVWRSVTINGAPTTITGPSPAGTGIVIEATANFTLNDVTVTGGTASGMTLAPNLLVEANGCFFSDNSGADGGGIFIDHDTRLELNDSRVLDNDATRGGGVFVGVDAQLIMKDDSRVRRNSATDGGGIYATQDADVSITASDVINNTASSDGGGIYNNDAKVVLTESVLDSNTATRDGGGAYCHLGSIGTFTTSVRFNAATEGHGGGMDLHETAGIIALASAVNANTAKGQGGGIRSIMGDHELRVEQSFVSNNTAGLGGGLALVDLDAASYVFQNAVVHGNTATTDGAGGIAAFSAQVAMADSLVSSNVAAGDGDGGGIMAQNGSAILALRTLFAANTAGRNGGAVYAKNSIVSLLRSGVGANTAGKNGGGIAMDLDADLSTLNTTIAQNTASQRGGGLMLMGPLQGSPSSALLMFTTVIDNEALDAGDGHQLAAENCQLNMNAVAIGTENITPGTVGVDCSAPTLFTEDTHDLDGTCIDAGMDGDVTEAFGLGLPTLVGAAYPPNAVPLPGAATIVPCPAVDQNGVARPANACAVGALE